MPRHGYNVRKNFLLEQQRAEELQGKEGNGVSTSDVSQHNYRFTKIYSFIDFLMQHYYSVIVTVKESGARAENKTGSTTLVLIRLTVSTRVQRERKSAGRQVCLISDGRRNGGVI